MLPKPQRQLKKLVKTRKILIVFPVIGLIGLAGYFFFRPPTTKSANLTSASSTLSNPRLSYKGAITSGTSGQTLITIDGASGTDPDPDTNHLFPKDSVCFTPSVLIGCRDNTAYSVATIPSTTTFDVSPALTTTLNSADFAIASQSGSLTIAFTTTNAVPSNGDILITIPMADNIDGNDSFPDSGTSTSNGGFDLNGIAAGDISTTGCTDGDWVTTETITEGSGTTNHTIRIDRQTTSCAASSAVTVTIDASPGILNPPPITSGSRVRGTADIYSMNIKTRDGSDNTLDEIDTLIAPVEAVLVSATVDETLSFRICGVDTDLSTQESACFSTPGTICGQASLSAASYAYSVPFGTMTSTDTFYNLAQYLIVSTNANGGYNVNVRQTDQLGKDGVTCSNGGAEDETVDCIKDTTCDGTTCTHLAAAVDDWETASYNGFGYSLDSVTGAPAQWEYDGTSGTCDGAGTDFCAAHFADTENSQTAVSVMTESGPVDSDDMFICYRMSVSPTQPAGYYYNQVKYTAVPIF